jgi:hypothetical protein
LGLERICLGCSRKVARFEIVNTYKEILIHTHVFFAM